MRTILFILGVFHGANGLVMLAAPGEWYALVPGVTETGPANIHFIRDIGFAFLAAGAGLVMAARREARLGALVPAAIFLAGHAGQHLVEMAAHGAAPAAALRDLVAIVIPGFLPAYAIWSRRAAATLARSAS
ncbi:MAG: hypothetical protein BroJett030_31380 [Alphaproteobacteria bacterium]|nr:MAG: hypothetical protein BroJett030_31380 [Alphaproteobacteria bacterium]